MEKVQLSNLRELNPEEQTGLNAGTTAKCNCNVTCSCESTTTNESSKKTAREIGSAVKQNLGG